MQAQGCRIESQPAVTRGSCRIPTEKLVNRLNYRDFHADEYCIEHSRSRVVPDHESITAVSSRVWIPLMYLLAKLAQLPVQLGQPRVDRR